MSGLLLTRPAQRLQALESLAAERGWTPVSLPLFSIALLHTPDALRAALAPHGNADWWLFTSSTAVDAVAAAAPERWPRSAAIGATTAESLRQAGHPPDAVPDASYDSEALLALPDFEHIQGRSVVLLGNETGRGMLQRTLRARGARVSEIPVYRLQPEMHTAQTVAAAVARSTIAVLTSATAVERLWDISDEGLRQRLASMPLVVPSERVASCARERGHHGPCAVAQPMSNEALLDAADTLADMEDKSRDSATDASAHGRPDETDDKASQPAAAGGEPPAGDSEGDMKPPAGSTPAASDQQRQDTVSPPPRSRGGAGWLAWLLLILLFLLLAASGAGAFWLWQQWQTQQQNVAAHVDSQVGALESRFATQLERADQAAEDAAEARRAAERASSLSGDLQRDAEGIASSVERIDAEVARLTGIVDAGRSYSQLIAAEHLLLQANERLQLLRDVRGASTALELADRRLAAVEEPRFFPIREAIAAERSALADIEPVDRTALALRLAALIDRADRLRLRGGVPDTTAPELAVETAEREPDAAAWRRLTAAVGEALASVFVVRRTDTPVQPLMGDEHRALVRGVLVLRLESVRLALLDGDQAGYEATLDATRKWLESQFAVGDAPVDHAIGELSSMRREKLASPLPDISDSLTRLRQVKQRMDEGAR